MLKGSVYVSRENVKMNELKIYLQDRMSKYQGAAINIVFGDEGQF